MKILLISKLKIKHNFKLNYYKINQKKISSTKKQNSVQSTKIRVTFKLVKNVEI